MELWDQDSLRKSLILIRNPLARAPTERKLSERALGQGFSFLHSSSREEALWELLDKDSSGKHYF
jgi:hypothetical protein